MKIIKGHRAELVHEQRRLLLDFICNDNAQAREDLIALDERLSRKPRLSLVTGKAESTGDDQGQESR